MCRFDSGRDQGHPRPHYLPHDSPGRLQDDPSARGHTASDRRARGAGDRAYRGPRALRGMDGSIRYSDVYRGAPGGADAPLCRHRGGDDPERRRSRPGTGRCHGELRDRQPPGALRAYRMYAPGKAGDLHRRGTSLPRVLETMIAASFATRAGQHVSTALRALSAFQLLPLRPRELPVSTVVGIYAPGMATGQLAEVLKAADRREAVC